VLQLQAIVASSDGARIMRSHLTGIVDQPEELGLRVSKALLEQGASELLSAV